MLEFRNQDSSYFRIKIPGETIKFLEKFVKSISIQEKEFQLTTGSITFDDRDQIVTDTFFPSKKATAITGKKNSGVLGKVLELEWGYKDPLKALAALAPDLNNPTELKGPIFRAGLKGVVVSPSGSMGENGAAETTIQFMNAVNSFTRRTNRVYQIGTRGTVILQVFIELGILTPLINFEGMETPVLPSNPVRRSNETGFEFLKRKAEEWNCVFRISNTPIGTEAGIFANLSRIETLPFATVTTGAIGRDFLFEYARGKRNVISADWENQFGQANVGDNVQLRIVAGKPQTVRTTAQTEQVQSFKLDTEKLKRAFQRAKATGGVAAAQSLLTGILNATDFNDPEIRKYWVPAEYKTAPNSAGTTVTIETFGSTLYSPPIKCKLGKGFPKFIQDFKNWRISGVDHTINREGYRCSIECQNFPSNSAGFI